MWPEKARKSQPNSCTSTGKCPALCAASTNVSTPIARAFWQSFATGLIVPSEFEMWVKAKSFTSGVSKDGSSSRANVPSSRTGTKRSQHRLRLLRCRGAVEVDQGMAVGPLTQDREILADSLPIYDAAGHLVHGLICSTRRRAPLDSRG